MSSKPSAQITPISTFFDIVQAIYYPPCSNLPPVPYKRQFQRVMHAKVIMYAMRKVVYKL
jgi:hypothetical protein